MNFFKKVFIGRMGGEGLETDCKLYKYNHVTGPSLNFMAAVTICSDFGAPKNKV